MIWIWKMNIGFNILSYYTILYHYNTWCYAMTYKLHYDFWMVLCMIKFILKDIRSKMLLSFFHINIPFDYILNINIWSTIYS